MGRSWRTRSCTTFSVVPKRILSTEISGPGFSPAASRCTVRAAVERERGEAYPRLGDGSRLGGSGMLLDAGQLGQAAMQDRLSLPGVHAALPLQQRHGDAPTPVDLTDHPVERHEHAVEEHFGELMTAAARHDRPDLTPFESRSINNMVIPRCPACPVRTRAADFSDKDPKLDHTLWPSTT